MTDRDEHRSAPASGMRAEHDGHATAADSGWPRDTAAQDDTSPEESPEALEEEASVRRAIDDDTTADAFTDRDTGGGAGDRGPLAPEFREPDGDA